MMAVPVAAAIAGRIARRVTTAIAAAAEAARIARRVTAAVPALGRRRIDHIVTLVMTAQTTEGHQHHNGSLHCIPPRCEIEEKRSTRDRHR
jgi:hypothetical protein